MTKVIKGYKSAIKATNMADKNGSVVIYKRNKPRYVLTNIEESPIIEMSDEGLLDSALESAFATFDGKDLYPTIVAVYFAV